MKSGEPLWLVGDAVVDVTIPTTGSRKLRLGGVCHAARALWAAGLPYHLAYIAPDYLLGSVERFAEAHAATTSLCVGGVSGAPNVLVVTDPTEAGPQGYEFLLRDERIVSMNEASLAGQAGADVLLLADAASLPAMRAVPDSARLHVDADVGPDDVRRMLDRVVSTYMTSTSDRPLRDAGSVAALSASVVGPAAERLLLKEGRGGARVVDANGEHAIGAQLRPVVHSVGVGDAFDAVWLSLRTAMEDHLALAYASACAAVYASTTFPDALRASMTATLAIPPGEMDAMAAVRVPVEERSDVSIYIAAPDFDWVDRAPIDALAEALAYQGFAPRLPVRENGQLPSDAGTLERHTIIAADLELLAKCQLLVAVLLFDDPGTLVELGIAHERGIPTIVFDPYERAKNPFVRDLPVVCTSSLDEVVDAVFVQVAAAE